MQIIQTKPLVSTLLQKKAVKQVEYQQQKANGRHQLLCLTDSNELVELHLTPDFTQITDSRLVMHFERCNQLLLYKDMVFALFSDRLEITRNEKTTEVRVQASCFDVCEVQRSVGATYQMIKNDALIKKIQMRRQVQSKCYRVVYATEAKYQRVVVRQFFVNDELQIVQSDFARAFYEQIYQIACTPELLVIAFQSKIIALGERGYQTLKAYPAKNAYIVKQQKSFAPLCLDNQNTQVVPLQHEFGPSQDQLLCQVDYILDKIHRKLQNPEFALEIPQAGLNVPFQRKKRTQFDSSLVALVDSASIAIFELREQDAQILKQLQLSLNQGQNKGQNAEASLNIAQGRPFFHSSYLHIISKQAGYLSCLNLYEDQDLKIIEKYDTAREIQNICQLNENTALAALNSPGDLILIQIAPVIQIITLLQNQLNFDPALGLLNSISDVQTRAQKSKQLHAQKALVCFERNLFKDAMRYFLYAKIDPTCVLYLYSHPSFQLSDAQVSKQQIFAEQILLNLPNNFAIPQFNVDNLRRLQNSTDLITDGIDQFRAFIHTWRADFFARRRSVAKDGEKSAQSDFNMQEMKMLANVDEALLKSFLIDPRGVDDREVNQILQGSDLFLEIESAIAMLQNKYQDSLIMFLKNRKKHYQALEMILAGQALNAAVSEGVAKRIADYLVEIGMGDKNTEFQPQMKKIHLNYYQCIFYTNPTLLQTIYGSKPNAKTHQLDALVILEFLEYYQNQVFQQYGPGFELLDFKALLLETALQAGNYYEQTREDVLLALVGIYIHLVEREAQKIEYAISQGQQWRELYQYLEQIIPVQQLKAHYKDQDNINFQEFLVDVQDELFSRALPLADGVLPEFPRALSEDIQGKIGQVRRKLTKLIQSLENVDYGKFLGLFPANSFVQDQAILHLKKYGFEIGLSLIAQALGRPMQAESICDAIYRDSSDAAVENRQFDIFLIFLKTFLTPVLPPQKPFIQAALSLILRKFQFFPVLETIQILRAQFKNIKVAEIIPYLRVQLSRAKTAECELAGVCALSTGKNTFQAAYCAQFRQAHTEISQTQRCMACAELLKRDIVVFENGRVVCSKCWANQEKCDVVRHMKPVAGYQAFSNVFY